jgi:hypothetical protein
MKRPVLFIDNFSKNNLGMFLRNLIQIDKIQCIFSSADASICKIFKLKRESFHTMPYCKAFSILPPCSFNGTLKTLEISHNPTITLASCYRQGELCEDLLFKNLQVKYVSEAKKQQVKLIFDLIKQQSKTCLQGMSLIVLKELFAILKTNPEVEDIWSELIDRISALLIQRKESLTKSKSLYFSFCSFSLEPRSTFCTDIEATINENLYFFGEVPLSSSHRYESLIPLERNYISPYTFKSYFPKFSDDVLTHFSLWHLAQRQLGTEKITTIANIIINYYNELKLESYSPQGNFGEQLALFSLVNASRQSFTHFVDGITLLKEFSIQVQNIPQGSETKLKDLITGTPPPILAQFLASVQVPYLVPSRSDLLCGLVRTGICEQLEASDGGGISFEICGRESGLIVCEMEKSSTKVNREGVKDYALRAIKRKSPITILLVNVLPDLSLKPNEDFDEKETVKETAKKNVKNVEKVASREPNQKKTKTESEKVIYSYSDEINRARIKDPSIPKDFDLNVYTLAYKDPKATDSLDLNFITLNEVEGKEPDGVFIIIESNAKFN